MSECISSPQTTDTNTITPTAMPKKDHDPEIVVSEPLHTYSECSYCNEWVRASRHTAAECLEALAGKTLDLEGWAEVYSQCSPEYVFTAVERIIKERDRLAEELQQVKQGRREMQEECQRVLEQRNAAWEEIGRLEERLLHGSK